MKKVMKFLFVMWVALASLYTPAEAQNAPGKADEFMKQAQEALDKKEHTKARYLFILAYQSFANREDYAKATECGTKGAALYYRENYYKEAFDLCRQIDQVLMTGEQKLQKGMPDLHFKVTKERLQMYMQLKNPAQAQAQLARLAEWAQQANNPALAEDLLYTQAGYHYTFGQNEQGDAYFQKMVASYKDKKEYDKVSDCYKHLITLATKAGNAPLVGRTYEKYILWTDSVKALNAEDKYNVLKQKYDASLQTIQEKDDTLSNKQYLIITLCTFAAILIAALVLLVIVLMRFILLTKKLKKNIEIANEHNELKTQFIRNISDQMRPTLDHLETSAGRLTAIAPEQGGLIQQQVKALKDFTLDIQELSSLENSLMEPYEVQPLNVSSFCKKTIEKIQDKVQPGVELAVDAASLEIKTNAEQLERILLHLLKNAALYTTSGKIKLEFKKRGAHICQFIVTDTGSGIPAEKRELLFKPFTEVKDLSEGDGLGLPICALIATKMNGTLTLDPEYTRGCRFILGLQV